MSYITYSMEQSPSWEANQQTLQLVKKSPAFMESESSSPYPQVPATCPLYWPYIQGDLKNLTPINGFLHLYILSTELIGNADIVRFIKSRRIAWLGHVMRMDDNRTPKRILQWKPIGTRTRGRPRKRWIAGIEVDLQIMGVRRWRKQCEERAEWKKITEKAKTNSGL